MVLAGGCAGHADEVEVGAQAGARSHLAAKHSAHHAQCASQCEDGLRLLGCLQDPLHDLLHDAAGLQQVPRVVRHVIGQLIRVGCLFFKHRQVTLLIDDDGCRGDGRGAALKHGDGLGCCLALCLCSEGCIEVNDHVGLALGCVPLNPHQLGRLIECALDVTVVLQGAHQIERVVCIAIGQRI